MTRAEQIRQALFEAIRTGAAATPDLPAPVRNEGLEQGLSRLSAQTGSHGWLNLIDLQPEKLGEEIGDQGEGLEEYDLPVRVEWVVLHPDDATREAAFDAGLQALGAILRADLTLNGTCDDLTFDAPDSAETVLSGVPQFKSCEFTVRLLFAVPDILS